MLELLKMPELWLGAAGIVGSCTAGLVAFFMADAYYQQKDMIIYEREPDFDMDEFAAVMSMEAAILECKRTDERRAEMVARAS